MPNNNTTSFSQITRNVETQAETHTQKRADAVIVSCLW